MKPEHATELSNIHTIQSDLEQARDLLIRNGDRSKTKRLELWSRIALLAAAQVEKLQPQPKIVQEPELPMEDKSA